MSVVMAASSVALTSLGTAVWQCPAQGTLGDGLSTAGVLVADIGAAPGESAGRVGDDRPSGVRTIRNSSRFG